MPWHVHRVSWSLGLILGFSPTLAASALGLVLLAGAAFGAVLTLVFDVKSGWSLTRSLIVLALTAALAFGGSFGIVWYFTNVLAHDPNLLRFPGAAHSFPLAPGVRGRGWRR